MATRGRDLETDFSFPRQMFPEYSYSPRESDAPPLGERSQRVEQRFNTVEYGRFSGLLEEGGGATYFRQNGTFNVLEMGVDCRLGLSSIAGRGKYVSYSTLCLPLQPPSTRKAALDHGVLVSIPFHYLFHSMQAPHMTMSWQTLTTTLRRG